MLQGVMESLQACQSHEVLVHGRTLSIQCVSKMLNNPAKQQRGTNQVVQPGIKANANQKVLKVGDPAICIAIVLPLSN